MANDNKAGIQKIVNQLKKNGTITTKATTKVDNNTTMLAKGEEPKAKTGNEKPNTSTETGKNFTPTVDLKTSPTITSDLKKVQSQLDKASDESNKKVRETLGKIKAGVDTAKESISSSLEKAKSNSWYAQQATERQNKRYELEEQKRTEINKNTTQDDLNSIYNEDGTDKDYSQEKLQLNAEIEGLKIRANETENQNERDIANEDIKVKQERLDYLNGLQEKKDAWEETYNLNWLKENNPEEYEKYREQLIHKDDNMLLRGATALTNVAVKTANIIPSAIDEIKLTGQTNVANENIDELKKLHAEGKIDDATYEDSLGEWDAKIEEYRNDYSDSFSQKIRDVSTQLSGDTYYGTNEVEKFILQAGESTAQFLLHYALTGPMATISMSTSSATDRFNELIAEGYAPETAMKNGFLTGLVSYATEKVGMDRFVEMLGTPISVGVIGSIIKKQAGNALSEGLEEVVEGLVDPVIDMMTLGTDLEVDGSELLMSFLLGSASGLAMGVGAGAISTVNTAKNINAYVEASKQMRADVKGQINVRGNLIINSVKQRNMVQNEINLLTSHLDTMTELQRAVAIETIQQGMDAIETYNNKSVARGIELQQDADIPITDAEANQEVIQSNTPNFNDEVHENQNLDATQNKIAEDLDELQRKRQDFDNTTQKILDANGYKMDAKVFNSLDEKAQNESLVALDFAKAVGLNINITNNKNYAGVNDKGEITIDGSKNPILATLAHELTHGVEASKYYDSLKEVAKKTYKGDWNEAIKNVDEKELVAQQVESLLNSEEFINNLVKYNNSIAHKIWMDLKAFNANDVTKELENKFDKAFANNPNVTDETKYSVGGDKALENLRKALFESGDDTLKNRTIDVDGKTMTYEQVYNDIVENKNEAEKLRKEMNDDGTAKYTEQEIHDKTGWWIEDYDDKNRFEFYDDGTINDIYNFVKDKDGHGTISKILDNAVNIKRMTDTNNLFFLMYPEFKDIDIGISKIISRVGGQFYSDIGLSQGDEYQKGNPDWIRIDKRLFTNDKYVEDPKGKWLGRDGKRFRLEKDFRYFNENEIKESIAHELEHAIQLLEEFKYGNGKYTNTFKEYWDRYGEQEARFAGKTQTGDLKRTPAYGNISTNENIDDGELGSNLNGEQDIQPTEGENGPKGGLEIGGESNDNLQLEEDDSSTGSQDDTWEYSEGETPNLEEQSEKVVEQGAKVIEEPEVAQEEAEKDVAKVLTSMSKDGKKATVKQLLDRVKYYLSDFGVFVDNYAKKVGNQEISNKYDYMLSSKGIADNALIDGHYDKDGNKIDNGISKVFEGLDEQTKEDFFNYLYHYRNYDLMSQDINNPEKLQKAIDERAKEIIEKEFKILTNEEGTHYVVTKNENGGNVISQIADDVYQEVVDKAYEKANAETTINRSVFGKEQNVTAQESMKAIQEYESKHPEFKEKAETIWKYEYNELALQKQYGLLSDEEFKRITDVGYHYVPTQRDVNNQRSIAGALDANKGLAYFNGSDEDILPLDETLVNRTRQVYRAITQNDLFNEMFGTIKGTTTKGGNFNLDNDTAENLGIQDVGGKHYITLYKNGEGIKLEIGQDLYDSLKTHKTYKVPVLSNIADFRRNVITGWNPVFWVTNGFKDIQDVPYNTKFNVNTEYLPAYLEAWRQIKTNGDMYKSYIANGGAQNNFTKLGETTKTPKQLKGLFGFGEQIETAPRLAEYIATINKGGSTQEAMRNAAEVTTNFKRGGTISKTLNANGFTFLNASIVGFQKQINNYTDAYQKNGAVGVVSYMAKLNFLYNVPLAILNHLIWKDDDDYKQLSEYVKDNYYCIGKLKNGTFIRIPKGRLNVFYRTVIGSGIDTVTGKKTLWEALVKDAKAFSTNIAPNGLSESSIIAPLQQALTNKTWYGGDIVPTRLQNVPDAEQYDASTDEISKWIGEKLNLSPMKINYVLDQYFGIGADIVLPIATLEAQNGIDNKVVSSLVAPVLDKFTTNSTLKNQNVTDFYEDLEELKVKSNSSKATDEDVLKYRYISTISSQMSELYKKKREIQADTTLGNKDKYNQVLEVQKQIDELAKYGLEHYDQMDIADNYADVAGVQYYKGENGWKKLTEDQLKRIDGLKLTTKEKSDFYNLYNSISDSREELKKATPEGKDADYREITIGAIQNSNLSAEAKNRVYDSYYNSNFGEYVNKMSFDSDTKLQMKYIYSMTDADYDEDGKAISNSKAKKIKAEYEKLGVYDDIIKYIKENKEDKKVTYSLFGLTKTVVEGDSSTSYEKAYANAFKAYAKANSSSGSNTSNTTKTTSTTAKNGSYINKEGNYNKAYASAVKSLKSSKISNDNRSVTCHKCGYKVVPVNGKCPICGASL